MGHNYLLYSPSKLNDIAFKFEVLKALTILCDVTACSSQIGNNVSEVPAASSSYTKA